MDKGRLQYAHYTTQSDMEAREVMGGERSNLKRSLNTIQARNQTTNYYLQKKSLSGGQ